MTDRRGLELPKSVSWEQTAAAALKTLDAAENRIAELVDVLQRIGEEYEAGDPSGARATRMYEIAVEVLKDEDGWAE